MKLGVKLSAARLADLRTAADIGIRIAGLQPHTVHVVPEELGALLTMIDELRADRERFETGYALSSGERDHHIAEVNRVTVERDAARVELAAADKEIGLLREAIRDMFDQVQSAWRDRQIAKETRDGVIEVVKRVTAATEQMEPASGG